MRTFLLTPFAVAVFCLGISNSSVQAQSSAWLASRAKTNSSGIVLPDHKGDFDLTLENSVGVTIGDKPPFGDDKKSLTFSGEQKVCFRTSKPLPISKGKTRVELFAKTSKLPSETESTLIRQGTQWEIRYSQKASQYTLICWDNFERTSTLRLPAKLDEWQKIEAEFDNKKMEFTVDGKTVSMVPKDGIRDNVEAENLFVGAAIPKPLPNEALPRAFIGSLADITVSYKK